MEVLSVKQMRELIDIGIDTSKAPMCWFPKMVLDDNGKPFVESHFLNINRIDCDSYWNTREGKNTVPTFTLQDILEMLPKYIKVNGSEYKWNIMPFHNQYVIQYLDTDAVNPPRPTIVGDSTLEVVFDMLKWWLNNKCINYEE